MQGYTFAPNIEHAIRGTLFRYGISRVVVNTALAKFAAGALPLPCEQIAKGKPYGLADNCSCYGCRETEAMAFLSMAHREIIKGVIPPR